MDPHLPEGFESRSIQTEGVRLHAVIGGEGPPVLLIPGWPQTWYAWRHVIPGLVGDHTVVAVDPRGIGRSERPQGGYDTGTLAGDLTAAMRHLGHERFAVVGHDVGMWIAYALAADHPECVSRLVVAEAILPGVSPSPPLLGERATVDRLYHFGFNRLETINEELVRGREHVFFGHQFATKAASPLPADAIGLYVETLARDPDALRASFEPYRHLDETIAQNRRRMATKLELPVLSIAGAESGGAMVEATMRLVANDVTATVLAGTGHYPAEEAPAETLAAISAFLG